VDSILNLWDHTDYWNTRYGSRETFEKYVAPGATNDEAFFQNELSYYWDSDEYAAWHRAEFGVTSEKFGGHLPPKDVWGDYTSIGFSYFVAEMGFIVDDYGNVYVRVGLSPTLPALQSNVSRGYILVNYDGTLTPLADVSALDSEKAILARNALEGGSAGASIIRNYTGLGGSVTLKAPYHVTVEGMLGSPGIFITPVSWKFVLWEAK
jgi:hypothetical protein